MDACDEPVILVGHSSIGGLTVSQAAELRPDKVAKLVYLSALLLPNGATLLDVARQDPDTLILPNVIPGPYPNTTSLRDEVLREALYGDCQPSDVALARALFTPQANALFVSPLHTTAENWGRIPRVYIECLHDRAVTLAAQRAMQQQVPCEQVITLKSAHSPFLSMPEELAEHLVSL